MMMSAYRVPAAAAVVIIVSMAAFATMLSRPEGAIGKSFAKAFDIETAQPQDEVRLTTLEAAPLHLSGAEEAQDIELTTAVWRPTVALGDRISIANRDGGTRTFEIVAIKALEMKENSKAGAPKLLLVKAVSADRLPTSTLRFVIEADGFGPQLTDQSKPRAL